MTQTGPLYARAHPRSRGENGIAIEDAVRQPGSSPLTRGKPRNLVGLHPGERLIPAHAGKTPLTVEITLEMTAHPRSRGENR